ncbi:MAG: pyridoxal phosphate-dependent aminotransferase [Deltaproteobacteria bacterium]|nr:pyridoxal phosphate-dependent aminotransferase [Deltaproteobacteria bacterium]
MRAALSELKPSLIRQIHALKQPSSIDCSLGEPTLPIEPELWVRGLARYEREAKGYAPNLGLRELRDRIAKHHALPGRATGDNVIVTVGSEEALFLAFFTLLDMGDEVVIADPAYPAYAGLATMCGARAVRVPLRAPSYALCTDDVAAAVTDRTRLVVVSAPSNPFGRCDDQAELRALATLAGARGFYVLSDEIYKELYFGAAPPPSITQMSARTLLVSGLSKSCAMTGHRLGYLVAPAELVAAMWPVHQLTVTTTSTLAQQLAIEAFAEPRFLSAHREHYRRAWAQARAALDMYTIPYIEPEGAFYAMCPIVPEGVDAFDFCKRFLAAEDVVVVPGTAFGPGGARFVRLSFAGAEGDFVEATKRLAAFLTTSRSAS